MLAADGGGGGGSGKASGGVWTAITALGGRPHAETQVLAEAGKQAEGSTLYVTLEPCCHHGQTPPCVDAIIAAGVARVVVAMRDPDARVKGKGIRALRQAGLRVDEGVLQEQAEGLYRGYCQRIRDKRPWVTVKMALSRDGKLARVRGKPTTLSCRAALDYSHWLRLHHDGILVGIDTVLSDDPMLTCRLAGVADGLRHRLVRIVIDSAGRMPLQARMLRVCADCPLWLVTGSGRDENRTEALGALAEQGCDMITLEGDKPFAVPMILEALAERGLTRLLVEGGAVTVGHFMASGCVDELIVIRSPQVLGEGGYDGFCRGEEKTLQDYRLSVPIYKKGQDCIETYRPLKDTVKDTVADKGH